jgi:hypothetical protein
MPTDRDRNRVEAFLGMHEGAAGFLMAPLAGPTIDLPNPTEQPGAEIGRTSSENSSAKVAWASSMSPNKPRPSGAGWR